MSKNFIKVKKKTKQLYTPGFSNVWQKTTYDKNKAKNMKTLSSLVCYSCQWAFVWLFNKKGFIDIFFFLIWWKDLKV